MSLSSLEETDWPAVLEGTGGMSVPGIGPAEPEREARPDAGPEVVSGPNPPFSLNAKRYRPAGVDRKVSRDAERVLRSLARRATTAVANLNELAQELWDPAMRDRFPHRDAAIVYLSDRVLAALVHLLEAGLVLSDAGRRGYFLTPDGWCAANMPGGPVSRAPARRADREPVGA